MNDYFSNGFRKAALSLEDKRNMMLKEPQRKKDTPRSQAIRTGLPSAALGAVIGGGTARKSLPARGLLKRMGKGGLIGAAGGALLGAARSYLQLKRRNKEIRNASPEKVNLMYRSGK
jgi:hypothetical protein